MSTMRDFTFVHTNEVIPPGEYQVLFVPQGWSPPVGGDGSPPLIHDQNIASDDWEIAHPFAYRPAVYTVDNNGDVFFGDVTHTDDDTVVHVKHRFPQTGKAYLR